MQVRSTRLLIAVLCLLAAGQAARGQELRLPKVFGDHMVLQQELPVVVWGWERSGQEVLVQFAGQVQSTNVGGDGHWRVTLDPEMAVPIGLSLRMWCAGAPIMKSNGKSRMKKGKLQWAERSTF